MPRKGRIRREGSQRESKSRCQGIDPEQGESLCYAKEKGISDVEDAGKNLVEDNIPGVKEVNSLKEEVDKAKDIGSVLKS